MGWTGTTLQLILDLQRNLRKSSTEKITLCLQTYINNTIFTKEISMSSLFIPPPITVISEMHLRPTYRKIHPRILQL